MKNVVKFGLGMVALAAGSKLYVDGVEKRQVTKETIKEVTSNLELFVKCFDVVLTEMGYTRKVQVYYDTKIVDDKNKDLISTLTTQTNLPGTRKSSIGRKSDINKLVLYVPNFIHINGVHRAKKDIIMSYLRALVHINTNEKLDDRELHKRTLKLYKTLKTINRY